MRDLLKKVAFRAISALALILSLSGARPSLPAQEVAGRMTPAAADPTAQPPYGIAVKRPLLAGACKGCPWGALSFVAAEALKPYGYEVQVCWVCWSTYGPREVADRAKPLMPPDDSLPFYTEPPPDGAPDFGITSTTNLADAWYGRGDYAVDHKPRKNFRVVATVQQTNYMITAVTKKSGITSLQQIKDRTEPTWLWIDGMRAPTMAVLRYYGITEEALKAKGGGIIHPRYLEREKRASADVYIGGGLLVNTPEQHTWYEVSQLNDLVYLQMDDALIDELLKMPGYTHGTIPMGYMRGVERRIPTVVRSGHVFYVRDDAPDSFAYALAKALDEHQELFRMQAQPYWYDPRLVGVSTDVPLHKGALKYYRERHYIR